jgi:hypothetical protein
MKVLARTPLTGTAAEIEAKLREAGRLAPDNGLAGTRLCDLAVVLAANPLLQVTVVTYSGSPQGLEMLFRGALQRDAVTVSIHSSGAWCQIEWNTWAPVGTDTDIATTADLITTILQTGTQAGSEAKADGKDPPDPQLIMRDLPEDDRDTFTAQYRQPLDEARESAGWKHLLTVLRLWRYHAQVAKDPRYWQAREEALAGTGDGMPLEDYLRLRHGADEQ